MSLARKIFQRKPSLRIASIENGPESQITKAQSKASSHNNAESLCNLMVIGYEGVGKTALVVRFLAKRFLPEYDGEEDKTYLRSVQIEEKLLNLSIIDKSGKDILNTVTKTSGLENIDGVIVVFSLTDSQSFDACLDLLDFFKFDCQHTIQLPILVIGNKLDLLHLRSVGSKEAEKCVLKYPDCSYEECSAASSEDDTVEIIFRSFIKKASKKVDCHELKKNGRKVSVTALGSPKIIRAHFKRRFSMFGRDRSGSQ